MPVNGPPKGVDPRLAPLTPATGTPPRRSSPTVTPALGTATTRTQAPGGPPRRANSLPATAGLRAPQGASLPPRRDTLPPRAQEAGGSPGFVPGLHGFPGMAPHSNGQNEQLKKMAEQVESTFKTAQELGAKAVESANKAADGVKEAVSVRT